MKTSLTKRNFRPPFAPFTLAALALCFTGAATTSSFAKRLRKKPTSLLFTKKSDYKRVIRWHRHEKRLAGKKKQIKFYFKKKYKNSVIMQRSGRKRLYDHNIFLRALYHGKLVHRKYGNLKPIFNQAVFIDIGSAILLGRGAPTVRDIYGDKKIKKYLKQIMATDINLKGKKAYIDIYRKKKKQLPFEVREIPLALKTKPQFAKLGKAIIDTDCPIIFRSANSGPDLFYKSKDVKAHFKTMLNYYRNHDLIYLYNKFILYKPAGRIKFHRLGEIDYSVAFAHDELKAKWRMVNWRKRKFKHAVRLNKANLRYRR